MRSLRSRLPPLNSIVIFDAVARHLSITRASEELLVSREAVSRSVRSLETHLGVRLFVRRHRSIELTAAGRILKAGVSEGLTTIVKSVERTRPDTRQQHVTVWATVALAHFWLTPRLPRFRDGHREIELHVRASDAQLDMAVENIDVALRYGTGTWPGQRSKHLFDTETFPVCAPSYLESAGAIHTPADLLRHTLLNLDGDPHADENWTWWLSASGVRHSRRPVTVGFDSYADVIEAALDAQGVALGFSHVVDDLIARGELVRPLPNVLSKGYGVYAVVAVDGTLTAEARTFLDWLVAVGRAERRSRAPQSAHGHK
jgi:LysR family glycine cleavage system transcriptional activator